ncbi:hypothetical protein [Cellulomonas chengniuliangii]|uniref:Uncharacterized protein n=1 Tax=Cellulomonas chengniuliangii TaxID=2968084 RepID=A0ABY5KZP5_9CELL|nr:hypothetical protein [Cellulomonas chengniuliangii]MCC2309748.1 hypothetical protein [Cellulomonas chengniuliangii]UUI74706.1 hypothetical protein NP064_13055 [Cellulomonas chengniuliangii]
MRTIPITAAASCALLLLISACASGGDAEPGKGGKADAPLTAYMDALYDIDYQKVHTEEENLIASCMQEAGFEYIPREISSADYGDDDETFEFTEDYAAREGYGYSSPEPESDDAEPVDPNADYLAAMSESERAAYELALWGEQDEPIDDEAEYEWDWTKAGCSGKASNEAWAASPMAAFEDPAYADLNEQISRLYDEAYADPKIAAVDATWSACMNEAGYDFAQVLDANNSFADQYSALWQAADPEAGTDKAAEAALREREVATAVADARCQKEAGYDETLMEVVIAYEKEFVDQHKAELDAWVSQYATAPKASK